MQVITQAVEEWLAQHGSNLGDEALHVLQRGNPMKCDRRDSSALHLPYMVAGSVGVISG
jgi:hypothetical protein